MSTTAIVEVRDADRIRRGQIDPRDLDIKIVERFRGVGMWELTLPADNELVTHLRTAGSGIVVSDYLPEDAAEDFGEVFSGPMVTATYKASAEDPEGSWTFVGLDDNVIAQFSLAYPTPGAAADAQTDAYDKREDVGETVLKGYVDANIGPSGTVARSYDFLTIATDQGRGTTAIGSARFDLLADLLTALAVQSGLGWKFTQDGTDVSFDVYEPVDRSAFVRMSIVNDTLTDVEWSYTAPTVTDVVVMGQGEGADRDITEISTTASDALAAAWGMRREAVIDARDTEDPDEIQARGLTALAEGVTTYSVKFTPAQADAMVYGLHWSLGDIVEADINGIPTPAVVTEVARSINSEGDMVIATLDEVVTATFEDKVIAKINQQENRLSYLERNAEGVTQSQLDPQLATLDDAKIETVKVTTYSTADESGTHVLDPRCRFLRIMIQGGGGQGGSTTVVGSDEHSVGGGGGGGAYIEILIPVSYVPSGGVPYWVGAGGDSSTSGAGENGGESGITLTTGSIPCSGGDGGYQTRDDTSAGSATGGIGAIGDASNVPTDCLIVHQRGGSGGLGWWYAQDPSTNPSFQVGGKGGDSGMGTSNARESAGNGTGYSTGYNASGLGYGTGGGGACSGRNHSAFAGGSGNRGAVIFEEYIA